MTALGVALEIALAFGAALRLGLGLTLTSSSDSFIKADSSARILLDIQLQTAAIVCVETIVQKKGVPVSFQHLSLPTHHRPLGAVPINHSEVQVNFMWNISLKLYANCLMSTLNARKNFSHTMEMDEPSLNAFNWEANIVLSVLGPAALWSGRERSPATFKSGQFQTVSAE
ncbi:hypothetical protein K438DRAFT_1989197 [Mycena galopus ATCC 62051]|nr:hypothetical protein K438DRAFT_1989197 [Mycena galopus ATCC 62051]